MPKKVPSNLESQLEWYYVSTQTLVRILIGILVLAGAIAGGVFFFLKRDETAVRAKQAIAEADDALVRARQQKDAALLGKEIASAEEMLGDARKDLAAGSNEKAARTAVEVKSRALKIIAGASLKSNANVVDTAGDVQIQKANRNTWETPQAEHAASARATSSRRARTAPPRCSGTTGRCTASGPRRSSRCTARAALRART